MLDRFFHIVRTVVERFLLLWLLLISLLSYSWTEWISDAWDPFVLSAPWLKFIFSLTMLAIGSLLPREEVEQVFKRWPTVLGGTTIQYLSMPLLAYALGHAFGLEGPWMIGVLVVGCVPGAMASNVLTLVAKGNVSYSVSLTTSATLLSPLVVPVVLWLVLSQWVQISILGEAWKLSWMVVIPVLTGHYLSRRFALWETIAQRVAALIANMSILWIIAVVVALNRDRLPAIDGPLLGALLSINLGGYLIGTAGGYAMRLKSPMRRALTLEIGMQNAGLGATLAVDLFGKGSPESIAPAIYTFGCMFTGTLLARGWAEWGERTDKKNLPA